MYTALQNNEKSLPNIELGQGASYPSRYHKSHYPYSTALEETDMQSQTGAGPVGNTRLVFYEQEHEHGDAAPQC